MLLVSRSKRASIYVPIVFVLFFVPMAPMQVAMLLERPSVVGVVGVLVMSGLALFILGMINVSVASREGLTRYTLFGRRTVGWPLRRIEYVVERTSRSVDYRIFASDGARRVELATTWTRRGAERDTARLRATYGLATG